MFQSHFQAGTGAVLVETREESRLLRDLLAELPSAEVCTIAAPSGKLVNARTERELGANAAGMDAAYRWVADGPGRVLVVHDWHTLANAPGHWRSLLTALPTIRSPGPRELAHGQDHRRVPRPGRAQERRRIHERQVAGRGQPQAL